MTHDGDQIPRAFGYSALQTHFRHPSCPSCTSNSDCAAAKRRKQQKVAPVSSAYLDDCSCNPLRIQAVMSLNWELSVRDHESGLHPTKGLAFALSPQLSNPGSRQKTRTTRQSSSETAAISYANRDPVSFLSRPPCISSSTSSEFTKTSRKDASK